jgi:hypothetical protein
MAKTDPDRTDRLAAALRANLRRRKGQEQAREADPEASALVHRPVPVPNALRGGGKADEA